MSSYLNLPFEINNVTPEENKLIKKCLIGYSRSFVKCGKNGYVMPGAFRKCAEMIYNFEVRPDDVWVITYPRSGTTWTQEMVWLIENNLNFEAAKEKPLYERFPMLEITAHVPEIAFELIKANFLNLGNFQGLNEACRVPSWKSLEESPSPRFVKTHLPLSLLPPKLLNTAKVIYVARDPRDVAISYYYLHQMVMKSLNRTTFKHFWEAFSKDLLPCSPIVAHANEAWEQRHHPNLHLIFYEDLVQNLPKEVDKLCNFLGKDYTTCEKQKLAEYVSFNSLRKNKSVNNTTDCNSEVQFIRQGKSNSWKSHFDEKMELQAEDFLIERLRGLDLVYPNFQLSEYTHL